MPVAGSECVAGSATSITKRVCGARRAANAIFRDASVGLAAGCAAVDFGQSVVEPDLVGTLLAVAAVMMAVSGY